MSSGLLAEVRWVLTGSNGEATQAPVLATSTDDSALDGSFARWLPSFAAQVGQCPQGESCVM